MNPNRMNEIRQNTERIRAQREKEARMGQHDGDNNPIPARALLDNDPSAHWSHEQAKEPRFEHDAPNGLVHGQPSLNLDKNEWAKDDTPDHTQGNFGANVSAIGRETLPTDAAERKGIPVVTGLLDYFPAALAEVAKVSRAGNDKHNPGEPMHWARGKSMDQADCIGRHLMERGGFDPETGQRHSAQMAWRALALLQLELEEAGAPMARGAK